MHRVEGLPPEGFTGSIGWRVYLQRDFTGFTGFIGFEDPQPFLIRFEIQRWAF
jgi:hypothetical protein